MAHAMEADTSSSSSFFSSFLERKRIIAYDADTGTVIIRTGLHRNGGPTGHPLRSNVAANSQSDPTTDGQPPKLKWYVRLETRVKELGNKRRKRRNFSMSKENFTRTIMLEMYDKDGKPVKKSVQVLLDTGNPLNVLSWKTVKTYGLERLVHGGPRTGLKTMGGHEFTSIGRIKGRVLVETNDPRWLDAEFEVSASDDHYDVVLGSEFLAEHHLVQVSKKFPPAYSGFRTKPAEYTEQETKQAEAEQEQRKAANQAKKAVALASSSAAKKPSSKENTS